MAKFNFNLLILLVAVLVLIMQVRSCLADNAAKNMVRAPAPIAQNTQSSVIVAEAPVADGLDLEAVGALLNQAQNAEELERLLNAENGVNNLDLNADGITDFISVTEFGSGDERGFALSTELAPGEEQEIATIRVKQQAEGQADVQIQGNQTLYGPNYYYHSRIGIGEVLLLGWLFRPHLPYYSPFAWGYYPGYYGGGYRTVSSSRYRSRTAEARQNNQTAAFQKSDKPQFRPQSSSPKANANASSRSSLGGAQRSQRSFRSASSTGSASGTSNAQKNSAQTSSQSRSSRSSLGTAQRSQRSFSSVRRSSSFRSGSRFGGGK